MGRQYKQDNGNICLGIEGQRLLAAEAADARLENLLEVVAALAELDFSKQAQIYGDGSFLDGLAYGLNLLSEELQASTVSRDYYDGIIQSMADGLLIVDANHEIADVNPALSQLLGYTRADLIGLPWASICPHLEDSAIAPMRDLKFDKRFETSFTRADGSSIDVAVSGSILRREAGAEHSRVYVVKDITTQKQLEQSLAEARDAAVHSATITSSFLANMSHEIRTPLNGVIGMASLLLNEDIDDGALAKVEAIHDCATLLLNIVNDILDFSKLEAGKSELHVEELELQRVVENLLHVYAVRAEHKGLDLIAAIEPTLPARIRGDVGALRQVLGNLISNAIKFTDRGEVVVEVRVVADRGSSAVVAFEVRDTGIGIESDALQAIFEAFRQVKAAAVRQHEGTGLGLAICRELVALMGGRVHCESAPGYGSRFWFELTFETGAGPDEAAAARERGFLAGATVLVLDDNPTQGKILARLIEHWGGRAIVAESHQQALAQARRAPSRLRFAIVDDQIATLDKPALLRDLRRVGGDVEDVEVILMTPLSSTESLSDLRDAGVIDSLPKPVKNTRLRALLQARCIAQAKKSDDRSAVRADAQPPRLAPLLVVDDNPINRAVLIEQLKRLGLSAVSARDGREAVRAVRETRFSLVLMDLHMPEMDGYEATRHIRELANGVAVPIVAVTANATPHVRERCFAAGMDEFLSKPVRVEQLLASLSRWVEMDVEKSASEPAPPLAGTVGVVDNDDDPTDAVMTSVGIFRTGARVLIVDDNAINQLVLSGFLRRVQVNAEAVGSGRKAIAAAARRHYDIIFLDVRLGDMTGIEVTQAIRGAAGARRPVILAVTADGDARTRERCLAADMDGFMPKPTSLTSLMINLALWLGPRRTYGGQSAAEQLLSGQSLSLSWLHQSSAVSASAALAREARRYFLHGSRERLERLHGQHAAAGADREELAATAASGQPAPEAAARAWQRDVFALVTWASNLGALRLASMASVLVSCAEDERGQWLSCLERELATLIS
ncbi:MAG: hypothetical protein Tsb0020_34560 [Haliangiales bacterium]